MGSECSDSSIDTFIIAPWGNPFTWNPITYLLDNIREAGVVTSTAPILRKYLDESGDSVRVLLFVPETIMCPGKNNSQQYAKFTDYNGKPLVDLLGSSLEISGASDKYKEIIRKDFHNVMEKFVYREVCEKIGLSRNCCSKIIKIIPTPNIGTYACGSRVVKWTIHPNIAKKVEISTYYGGVILLEEARNILNPLRKAAEYWDVGKEIKIVLDVTHGVNFMPLMTYRATAFMTRLVSVFTGLKTKIIMYNSEPYSRYAEELTIYEVERETFTSNRAVQRLVYSYASIRTRPNAAKILKFSGELGTEIKDINEKAGMLNSINYKVIDGIAASIHYSLPLALLTVNYWDKSSLDQVLSLYSEYINTMLDELPLVSISRTSDKLIIKYLAALNYDYVKAILSIPAFKAYAERIYENTEHYVVKGKLYVDVEVLDKVLENMLRGPHYFTSRHELDGLLRLEKKCLKLSVEECGDAEQSDQPTNPLVHKAKCALMSNTEICGDKLCKKEIKKKKDIYTRHFIAHGGLMWMLLCIKGCIKGKECSLRIAYRNDCRDEVFKLLNNSLGGLKDIFK